MFSRRVPTGAEGRVVAADVSVLFSVDLLPETPHGSAPRFCANAPPWVVDSAASESLGTGPAGSLMGCWEALGSVVTC